MSEHPHLWVTPSQFSNHRKGYQPYSSSGHPLAGGVDDVERIQGNPSEFLCEFPGLEPSDGTTKKQWVNQRLCRLYRGTSVGPYSLQSILMALESWLSLVAKHHSKSLYATLVQVLKANDSGAITAVVASIVIAYPRRCGEALLALLSCPTCIALDVECHAHEREAAVIASVLPNRPEQKIYGFERKQANELEHPRNHFEEAVLKAQGPELAQRIDQVLDDHKNVLPPIEVQEREHRLWRLSLQRVDLRRYSMREEGIVEDLGTLAFLILLRRRL